MIYCRTAELREHGTVNIHTHIHARLSLKLIDYVSHILSFCLSYVVPIKKHLAQA